MLGRPRRPPKYRCEVMVVFTRRVRDGLLSILGIAVPGGSLELRLVFEHDDLEELARSIFSRGTTTASVMLMNAGVFDKILARFERWSEEEMGFLPIFDVSVERVEEGFRLQVYSGRSAEDEARRVGEIVKSVLASVCGEEGGVEGCAE